MISNMTMFLMLLGSLFYSIHPNWFSYGGVPVGDRVLSALFFVVGLTVSALYFDIGGHVLLAIGPLVRLP